MGSFSGLGTKILHAARGGQKRKKYQTNLEVWDSESFWVGEQGGARSGAPGEDMETLCPLPCTLPFTFIWLFLSYILLFKK